MKEELVKEIARLEREFSAASPKEAAAIAKKLFRLQRGLFGG